jgi:predicted RNA-binding protein (virulence factor B family)
LRELFGLSKKAFKRAAGRLLKQGLVSLDAQGCLAPVRAGD